MITQKLKTLFFKISQQLADNFILIVLLVFASLGSYRSTQVKVELNDLTEMKTQLLKLEARCTEMERMREDMDDLRYAFAKAVTHRTTKTVK